MFQQPVFADGRSPFSQPHVGSMRKVLIGLPLAHSSNFSPENLVRELAKKGFDCSVVVYSDRFGDAEQIISRALSESADLIFVDRDIVLFEDTIGRMMDVVASDPMIAFVSPRLNCPASHALPLSAASGDPHEFHELARRLAPRLPETTYAPNVIAACFYARHEVVRDFGVLKLTSGDDGQAINDLAIRANRCGYRAAIANRAYAYSTKERSQNSLGSGAMSHNDHLAALDRHLNSPTERALRLLAQCETSAAPTVAFDFSTIGTLRNGTSEYSVALVANFARLFADRYRIDVLCGQDAWDFHGLSGVHGIRRASVEQDKPYAAIVRTSQPFTLESLALASSRGAVSLVVMHDAIAYDCLHLAPPELHQLWSFLMRFSDVVIYVSKFSQEQLARRFATNPDVAHVICMPSTDVAEYAKSHSDGGDYLLIVGNDFAHKALQDTVDLIRARFPVLKLGVFGTLSAGQTNVLHFPDGQLSSAEVATIFANARAVVYPSHYEGFGFPIMHALANGKRIFARDLPVYHEIKSKVAAGDNVHLFKHNAELLEILAEADFAWRQPARRDASEGWEPAVRNLEALLRATLQSTDARTIERRLVALDMLAEGIAGRRAQCELQEKVTHLENVAAHSQRHLEAVHSSFSWRVTKALRALGRIFPRGRN